MVESNRWRKWLTPDEAGRRFDELAERQDELSDPRSSVVERVAQNVQKYVDAFNLRDSLPLIRSFSPESLAPPDTL